jgi:plastocyanin
VVAAAAMLIASRGAGPREIRLVARDMTFFVDGDDAPNPTLKLRAGEQVRVTLRNEDAGMSHDFVVTAWHVGSRLLDGRGEAAVVFRVPATTGRHEYSCTPHSATMRGAIEVE